MATYKNRTFARRIGQKALTFRIPVVVAGEVSYIHPDTFVGRWLVLSFVPALEKFDAQLWNRQGQELATRETALLLVPTETTILDLSKPLIREQPHYTIVSDPLNRLQRLYGGQTVQTAGRGRTFVIDPAGSLRFHHIHSGTEHGMSVLAEVLRVHQKIAAQMLQTNARKRIDPQETSIDSSIGSSNCSRFSLAT